MMVEWILGKDGHHQCPVPVSGLSSRDNPREKLKSQNIKAKDTMSACLKGVHAIMNTHKEEDYVKN